MAALGLDELPCRKSRIKESKLGGVKCLMSSPRIRLREHALGDTASFCDLQMDPAVGQYVSWLPRTRTQCEAALLDAIEQQAVTPRTRCFFAVELLSTAEMIGSVGYTKTDATADCGWFLRRRFWGNGYACEAVQHMISSAFGSGQLERLTASCLPQNHASRRVAEKCGFRLTHRTLERLYFELRRADAGS